MKFGILDLGHYFWVDFAPDRQKIEKRRCRLKCVCCLRCDFIGSHGRICSSKSLQTELLHVDFANSIVGHCLFCRMLLLELLKLFHHVCRVRRSFVTRRVKAPAQYRLDHLVFAVVCYHGVHCLELGCAMGKAGDIGCPQRGWHIAGHGLGFSWVL